MARGRFLSDYDEEHSDNVCVIADETAKKLFPYEDPLGKALQIDDTAYVIVGQTEDRMPSGNVGGSFASQITTSTSTSPSRPCAGELAIA